MRFNYWPARFIGALAAIVVGVPTITFGTVAYWNQMATSEVAHAAACAPTVYGTTVGTTRYIVEEFTTVGSCDWTVPTGVTEVDVLVVGGGGGGGENAGFGGAGGGVSESSIAVQPVTAVTVSVGSGGRGGGSSATSDDADPLRNGGDGGASTLTATSPATTITAEGGEGGLNHWSNDVCSSNAAANTQAAGGGTGATATGGAGGTIAGSGSAAGDGGAGYTTMITGTAVNVAAGGGGGGWNAAGGAAGGLSAGSGAGPTISVAGNPGAQNRGGGGGGGAAGCGHGGAGGSGIVIVRYEVPNSDRDWAGAFNTSGSGTAHFESGAEGLVPIGGPFTVELWVNDTAPNHDDSWEFFVSEENNEFGIGLHPGTQEIRIGNGWTAGSGATGVDLPSNQWVHVAVAVDGSSASLFLNGQLAASTTNFSLSSQTNGKFRIGHQYCAGECDESAHALIDEVRVWDVARSATDVTASMHSTLTGSESGLVAYWDFNQSAGNTVTAVGSAGSAATLTAVGAPVYTELATADTATRSGWTLHEFERSYITAAGGWTVPAGVQAADVLVVGGGGGGGAWVGGGGGGGGVATASTTLTAGSIEPVTVGQGGLGSRLRGQSGLSTAADDFLEGSDGQSSSFAGTSVLGGGLGASWTLPASTAGDAKASGGGGARTTGTGAAGNGSASNGGSPPSDLQPHLAGGGGGAGGNGVDGGTVANAAGNGGPGSESEITGTPVRYAGGGGGSTHGTYPSPPTCNDCSSVLSGQGTDGGGNGAAPTDSSSIRTGESGAANRGGGGGGSSNYWTTTYSYPSLGGNGGSGVVIVAYPICTASSAQTVTIGGIEYKYQTFTTPDSDPSDGDHNGDLPCVSDWTVPSGVTSVDVLVVGGGGGGGANPALGVTGGGGGAGGVILDTITTTPGTDINIAAGSGGDGATWGTDNAGDRGTDSVFGSLIAIGGGGGGSYQQAGTSGGSGGGNGNGNTTVGAGTAGQGSDGVYYNEAGTGGEGGGASGSGKYGVRSSITGTAGTYGQGGNVINSSPPIASSGFGGNGTYDYNAGTVDNGLAGASGTVIVRWVAEPADALPEIDLYARYRAGDYDPTTKIWTDSSGNARHTVASDVGGTPAATAASAANGASVGFPIVTGGTGDSLKFPGTMLTGTYTLFHLARYGGDERERILSSTSKNWLSGFWSGKSGIAYQSDATNCAAACWITQYTTSVHGDDWVLSSDKKSMYRSQGIDRTTNGENSTFTTGTLSINRPESTFSAETSDWQVADVLVFNRQLSTDEIRSMENHLGRAYGIETPGLQATGVSAATVAGQSTQLTVSWTDPTDVTPTAYTIEQSSDAGTTWTTATTSGNVAAAGTTITGLSSSDSYLFRVTPLYANVDNERPSAASTSASPLTTTSTTLTWSPASPDDTQTVTLTATVTDGGSPVANASVAFDAGGTTITGCGDITTNASGEATCSWTPGTAASYSITATTTGTGLISSTDTQSITVATSAPGQPTGLTATANGTGRVDLSWTAPANGATPTDYKIEYRRTGTTSWFAWNPSTSASTSESVTGLGSADQYDFRVTALASAQAGTPSSTATATTTTASVIREFTSTGSTTWRVPVDVNSADVLVVGGGGGGGGTGSRSGFSGGGGAGGQVEERLGYSVTPGEDIAIRVGAGGTGGSPSSNTVRPTEGGDSSFDGTITAVGGGRGGHSIDTSYTDASVPSGGSRNGGGGGAQAQKQFGALGDGGFHSGGDGFGAGVATATQQAAGGGAGAGGDGLDALSNAAGNGGPGVVSTITGSTYGGGGGGGKRYSAGSAGTGGSGGGGDGGKQASGQSGTDGTGGGGGGGGNDGSPAAARGGDGGDGIVLVRTTPLATSTPDLTAASDTGSSSSDNRTGDTTPTFTGTAQYGSTVQLYVDDGTGPVSSGSTCTPSDSSYIWSCTTDTLTDDAYEVTAIATFDDENGVTLNELSSSLEVTIDSSLSINSTTLADATFNAAYSATLTATGGTAPLSWAVTSGSLPTGLSLSTAGVLSGTPTAAGTSNFTVTVTDSNSPQVSDSLALSLTVTLASQTINFDLSSEADSVTYGDDAFSVAGTTTADGLVLSYSSTTPSVCTVSGDASLSNGATNAVVTPVGAGTCTVVASQAGDTRYAAATAVSRSFTVAKATQTALAFTSPGSAVWGDEVTAAVSGGSGTGARSFSATAGTAGCTIDASSGVVEFTSAGTCTITANKAGDTNHLAADAESQTLTITKAAQTVAFTSTVPANPLPNGTYTPTATATSDLVPSLSLSAGDGSVCSLSSGVVTFLTTGTCTVAAAQAGDDRFAAATTQTQTITVGSLNQSIIVTIPDDVDYGTPGFGLNAAATSDLAVTVTSADTDICTVAALVVTPVDIGDCELTVTQAGNNQYAAASPVTITFRVRAAVPTAPTITSVSAGNANATIAFTTPGFTGGVDLSAYTLVATPTSGDPITDTTCTASPCTINGLANGTAYTITITANNTAGSGPASTASPAITPATRATAVTTLAASPGNGTLRVTWGAPADFGGGTFTRYELRIAADGDPMPTEATATVTVSTTGAYTFTGLDNGTAYNVEVVTITSANQASIEGNTATLSSVPVSTPAQPETLTINTISPRVIQLSWAEPLRDGGATVTGYTVAITDGDGTSVECGSVTIDDGARSARCVSDLLELSTTYTVTVAAVNRIGTGPGSTLAHTTPTFTAPTSPPDIDDSADADECPCVYDTDGNPVPVDIDLTEPGVTPGSITLGDGTSTVVIGGENSDDSNDAVWVNADGQLVVRPPAEVPFSGSGGLPGTTVTVFIDGVAVGTATVADDGTWQVLVELPAGTTGPIDANIVWVDANGNQQTAALPIDVYTPATDAPDISIDDTTTCPCIIDADGNPVATDIDRTPAGATPGEMSIDGGTVTIGGASASTSNGNAVTWIDANGQFVAQTPGSIPFSGADALPGTTVTVFVDGVAIGTATVNADGTWTLDVELPAGTDGETTITIVWTDSSGQQSTLTTPITIIATGEAATAPRAPAGGAALAPDPDTAIVLGPSGELLEATRTVDPVTGGIRVDTGDSSLALIPVEGGRVTSGGRLELVTPSRVRVTGSGMLPGATATVWIMSDPIRLGTVTVAADGTIDTTYAIPSSIEPGNHTIQLDVPDRSGSPISVAVGITVGSGTLPVTGTDAGRHLAWLTLILALGALIALSASGRPGRRHSSLVS